MWRRLTRAVVTKAHSAARELVLEPRTGIVHQTAADVERYEEHRESVDSAVISYVVKFYTSAIQRRSIGLAFIVQRGRTRRPEPAWRQSGGIVNAAQMEA